MAAAALAFALPPLPVPAQHKELLTVSDVRFWTLAGVTRVAIEVSGDFGYRSDRLSNPDRLYFDVLNAQWARSPSRIHVIHVGDGLLKQIRVSETQPGVTRVVFDIEKQVEFTAAQLANPDRLMVELRPAAPPAPPVAAPPAQPVAEASKKEPPPPRAPAEDKVPLPAKPNDTGSRSLVRALGLKLGRVVIDPGHGGHDTGTIGPGGLMEKDLVLDVARRLGKLVEERLGAEVVYTRADDTFVALEERTAMANEKKADLFLSVHANSGYRSASGPETYYLNFTTSRDALEVAARENASSEKSIHELHDLIQKIALKEKVDESREFAGKVQGALSKANKAAKDRGVRKAPFVVLIGAQMPSVLAEIAFLSNPREEKSLKRPEQRQRIAEALYRGLSGYAAGLSHFQVAKGG